MKKSVEIVKTRSFNSKPRFDNFSSFINKRHRWIILGWIIVFLISLTMVSGFLSSVNYNITAPSGPTNAESQKAQTIMNTEFPALANSTGSNTVTIILQGVQPYSEAVKSAVLAMNTELAANSKTSNYTGMTSLYTEECSELNSIVPSLLQEVKEAASLSSSQQKIANSQAWQIASTDVANSFAADSSGSPFFSVNSTSLAFVLSTLSSDTDMTKIDRATMLAVSNQSFCDFALVPTQAVQ